MDFISIALGVISIAQNIRLKKSKEEKLNDLKEVYEQLSKMFGFLKNAKIAHDDFQSFDNNVEHIYKKLIDESDSIGKIERHNELKKLINSKKFVLKTISNQFDSNLMYDNESAPETIRINFNVIHMEYPDFVNHISSFKNQLEKLTSLSRANSGDGDEILFAVNLCKFHSKEALRLADQIILNTVPILDFINYELSNSINSL